MREEVITMQEQITKEMGLLPLVNSQLTEKIQAVERGDQHKGVIIE